jgi:hypothetical protein
VWGLQVPKTDIANAIDMPTDDPERVAVVHEIARAAWLLDVDMNALALWLAPSVEQHERSRLARLRGQSSPPK